MRVPLQQPPSLAQRLAYLPNVPVFEVAQAAMNNAGRATGGACCEIMLLDQERPPSGARAFPGNGDSVNAAANHKHMETLVLQRGSQVHARV
jgi:hypothetical protein